MNPAGLVTVRIIVAVGVLLVVPLGLRLIGGVPAAVVRWWPVPGVLGAASMWLPRGPLAVVLATVYLGATLLLAWAAVGRAVGWWRPGGPRRMPVEVAVVTALLGPLVAASALVAERAGVRLFGFSLPILTLTVPHLHFAGFAAALIAALVARRVGTDPARQRWADVAALSVPAGTVLVLLGYFVADWAELIGAVVLTVGMWTVGWLTITRLHAPTRGATLLLRVSAAVLAATMVLALSWAVGEATGWPHPSLGWMIATHGVANAFGFALCGLLAWRLIETEQL